MAIAELTNTALSFLTSSLSDSGFYQGLLGNATYDVAKKMGGLTSGYISKVIRQRLQEEEQTGKVPLNHDLRRAIRFAYLSAACNVIEEKKSQLSGHAKTLEHIITIFTEEKQRVYQEHYVLEVGINIPNITYSDAHKVHPAYQGDKDQLSEEVEGDLRREIRQRFEVDDYRDGVKELLKHLANTSIFSQLQNYFLQEYKDRELIQASFDGAVLVQLASRGEGELEALKTLPEETQQRVQNLLHELHSQIADHNQELGEVLKDYFDERSTLILIQLKRVEKKVDATYEQTVIANEKLEQLQADIQKLREQQSERDAKRRLERQRIAGELLTLVAFTGRSDKLSELHDSIYRQKTKLSQICGPVGRGKTALATKFVQDDKSFDSILFCSLRYQSLGTIDPIISLLQNSLPEDKATQLANLWKDQKDIPGNITATLRNIIGGHKTLIVIDNLEDALSDGGFKSEYETLALFVQKVCALDGHSCQLLVTSREPVDLTALGRDLGGKHSSQVISLDQGLNTEQGIALLRELGDEASGLKTASDEVLESLTEQVEGIPIVLSNLAGLLRRGRGMSISRFLANPGKLQGLKNEPARVLYESLTPDEQKVMQALAVYGKAVPEVAVRYLLPDLDTDSILYELENNYAVQFGNTEPITYSLRPLDQAYAYGLITEDIRFGWHQKAATYYYQLRKSKELWQCLEDLQPEMGMYEHWIAAGMYETAFAALMIVADHLSLWGYSALRYEMSLGLEGKLQDKAIQINYLNNLAVTLQNLGDTQGAIDNYTKALSDAIGFEDKTFELSVTSNLGGAYAKLGHLQKASEYLNNALITARDTNEVKMEGVILGLLASVNHSLGNIQSSIELNKQALAIAIEFDDKQTEGNTLNSLGNSYRAIGEIENSIKYYEKALAVNSSVGFRGGTSASLGGLAGAYLSIGKAQEAVDYYKEALLIAQTINDRHSEGVWCGGLGLAYFESGEIQNAVNCYEKALCISQEIGNKHGECDSLVNTAVVYLHLNQVQKSIDYFERALSISEENGFTRQTCFVNNNLGLAYQLLNELEEASNYFEKALSTARQTGYRNLESSCLSNLGYVLYLQGDVQKALQIFQKSIVIASEIGARKLECVQQSRMGSCYLSLGDFEKAMNCFEQALDIAFSINNIYLKACDHLNLGTTYHSLNKAQMALVYFVMAFIDYQKVQSPEATLALSKLASVEQSNPHFASLLYSLFPDGDAFVNTSGRRTYTYFRDAPPDLPDEILKAIADLDQPQN
jgi:tetratricopeptide (TPR) repeat protein